MSEYREINSLSPSEGILEPSATEELVSEEDTTVNNLALSLLLKASDGYEKSPSSISIRQDRVVIDTKTEYSEMPSPYAKIPDGDEQSWEDSWENVKKDYPNEKEWLRAKQKAMGYQTVPDGAAPIREVESAPKKTSLMSKIQNAASHGTLKLESLSHLIEKYETIPDKNKRAKAVALHTCKKTLKIFLASENGKKSLENSSSRAQVVELIKKLYPDLKNDEIIKKFNNIALK